MNKTIISYALLLAILPNFSFGSDTVCSCRCHPVKLRVKTPTNMVLEPKYVDPASEPQKQEECRPHSAPQVIYAPVTNDSPVLKEKEASIERKDGAEYEKGTELHVAPAPDHTVKQEEAQQEQPKPVEDQIQEHHLRRSDFQH